VLGHPDSPFSTALHMPGAAARLITQQTEISYRIGQQVSSPLA
jgi:hypothetical protein